MAWPPKAAAAPAALVAPEQRAEVAGGCVAASRGVLAAALFASPWAFGAVQTWAWASVGVVVAAGVFLWAVGSVRQGAPRIAWSPLHSLAGLFLLWGMVQRAGGLTLNGLATREAVFKFATDFLFFFLAAQLWHGAAAKAWRWFGFLATALGFLVGLFGILQFFSSQGLIYWTVKAEGWTFGPYVNHSHFAGLLEMLIPVSAGFLLSRPRNRPGRGLLMFSLAVTLASFLLSGSKGGMLSLLAGVSIALGMCWSGGGLGDLKKRSMRAPLGILAGLLLFFWVDPGEISARLAAALDFTRASDAGLMQREAVAMESLRLLKKHPWTGTGLGSFETAYAEVRSFPTDLVWEHAHNDYVEALVETGLVGGVLILVGVAFFFRLAFRDLARRAGNETGIIQLGSTVACCTLLVHSFFDFNLHIPANAAWFAVCAAAGIAEAPRGDLD